MKMKKYRPSFSCYFIAEEIENHQGIDILKNAGYSVRTFSTADNFLELIHEDPPHFICIHRLRLQEDVFKIQLKEIREALPETRIIWLGNETHINKIIQSCEEYLYQALSWPLLHPSQLLSALDHAAENIYYFYQNEQLLERLRTAELNLQGEINEEVGEEKRAEKASSEKEEDPYYSYADYQTTLFQQLSHGSSIEIFMKEIERVFSETDSKASYFKYISARKSLIGQFSVGTNDIDIKNIGLNLKKEDPAFRKSDIKNIESHSSFKQMMRDIFNTEKVHIFKLEVLGEVSGVLILWDVDSQSKEFEYIATGFQLLCRNCILVELDKRLHNNQVFDNISSAYNRNHFSQKLSEEISRARRTTLPVSFVLMSIDNFEEIKKQSIEEDIQLFLKSLIRIIQKHSRVNDLIGRISQNEFGLLLPHTASKGGAIKAERIRRMIESADFSQILPNVNNVTLSLSVSEYPSASKDADDLFQSADRALFESGESEKNRVVMVQPPDGFMADFVIEKPAY